MGVIDSLIKKCPHCNKNKNLSEFSKDKSRKSGRSSWCKSCLSKKQRERYKKNPSKYRKIVQKHYIKNKDKILADLRAKGRLRNLEQRKVSIDFYNELFVSQNGCCFICGTHAENAYKGLHIDHDHNSGEIRGLLCHKCNTALGLFQDNVDFLKIAIVYLNNSRKV